MCVCVCVFCAIFAAVYGDLKILKRWISRFQKAVLLDKGYLTDIRTAVAGSIASKYLSNENSTTVAIIGTGMQARLQLSSLCLVRNITHVNVWGRDESKIDKYIEDMCDKYENLDEFYSLRSNKGYGTKKHMDGIKKYGVTEWHRKSFKPCFQQKEEVVPEKLIYNFS